MPHRCLQESGQIVAREHQRHGARLQSLRPQPGGDTAIARIARAGLELHEHRRLAFEGAIQQVVRQEEREVAGRGRGGVLECEVLSAECGRRLRRTQH